MGCTVAKVTVDTKSAINGTSFYVSNDDQGKNVQRKRHQNHKARNIKRKLKIVMKHRSFYIDERICNKYLIGGKLSSSDDSVVLKVTARYTKEQFVIKILRKHEGSAVISLCGYSY